MAKRKVKTLDLSLVQIVNEGSALAKERARARRRAEMIAQRAKEKRKAERIEQLYAGALLIIMLMICGIVGRIEFESLYGPMENYETIITEEETIINANDIGIN